MVKSISNLSNTLIAILVVCQHVTRHLPLQSAHFHVSLPVLHTVTPAAASSTTLTTMLQHRLLHMILIQLHAQKAAPLHVHLSDALLTAAAMVIVCRIMFTGSVTKLQSQRSNRKLATSSVNIMGRIKRKQSGAKRIKETNSSEKNF